MIRGKVRRSQLVAPFGPGAMHVLSDGTSVITAGLDHWFRHGIGRNQEEFRIHEWRLEQHLGIDALYSPPDYRTRSTDQVNTGLTVPVLRFPTWSFCPRCRTLAKDRLHRENRPVCEEHETPGRKPFLAQVPFVAVCERGHLQDFPWFEWTHKTVSPTCRGHSLSLRSSGGGTLASQRVSCTCGATRNLDGITSTRSNTESGPSTFLSEELEPGGREYLCCGGAPWLGIDREGESCGSPLRGSLRGAANVYYSLLKSSIFVPEAAASTVDPKVLAVLQDGVIVQARQRAAVLLEDGDVLPARMLRKAAQGHAFLLDSFSEQEIDRGLATLHQAGSIAAAVEKPGADQDPAPFRATEYRTLRGSIESEELVVREPRGQYASGAAAAFARVRLVEKLRETRVLWGFNRVFAESPYDGASRKALLRRTPARPGSNWLPAYAVSGEGIFLELDTAMLGSWEERPAVLQQAELLTQRFTNLAEQRGLQKRELSPRFILLHTLAHLLINQLTYECGYSSASLRERLYESPGLDGMAGILIYTAAGDSEGTLGGLVRMGEPGRLEGVLENALAHAAWCSSDPVCIESKGQGPGSCNLAACHGCALLPETACEEYNRFLDRALVVGGLGKSELGFFVTN
ncbi:DrmB family protein [Streptomyces rubiginosohelvolus]|uniref:DrmB family protein n=1 Tax=Streptomyces rubiginosohelvolus TaxID=67362 RepID=UPI0035DB5DDE